MRTSTIWPRRTSSRTSTTRSSRRRRRYSWRRQHWTRKMKMRRISMMIMGSLRKVEQRNTTWRSIITRRLILNRKDRRGALRSSPCRNSSNKTRACSRISLRNSSSSNWGTRSPSQCKQSTMTSLATLSTISSSTPLSCPCLSSQRNSRLPAHSTWGRVSSSSASSKIQLPNSKRQPR